WCAGLLIGAGRDPAPLLERVGDVVHPELDADAVAQCLFESAMLPATRGPAAWVEAWPRLERTIAAFLTALERQTRAAGLAAAASTSLGRLILERAVAADERRPFL